MTTKRLYIAYGSNLHRGQMAHRCPDAKVEGVTSIPDYTLLFRGSGVATIEPKKGDSVPIVVWSISKRDEMSLDVYEGFPRLYIKQDFTVELNGETVTAMAYIMTPGREIAEPPVHYYNTILTGYKDFGMDTAYLKKHADACKPKPQTPKVKVMNFAKLQKHGINTHICPRCGDYSMEKNLYHNSLSRFADIYVCPTCGMEEGIMAFKGEKNKFSEWYAANI
ncbi:MAG: gamma-glutamylcyclotransferase [Ruminiclostridium sp.]|nr:gamma-glutamylcyclotransferase [Ruminiclostridium sp.]